MSPGETIGIKPKGGNPKEYQKLGLNHLPIPYLINIYKKLIRLNGMRHNRPVESILWNWLQEKNGMCRN